MTRTIKQMKHVLFYHEAGKVVEIVEHPKYGIKSRISFRGRTLECRFKFIESFDEIMGYLQSQGYKADKIEVMKIK